MTPTETVTPRPDDTAVTSASILVIDDDAAVRQVLGSMLRADGHLVETVQNGRDGVDCLRNRHFDVALTDLLMPDMDGIQTMAALKALDADIEVVIVTGKAGVDSASAAFKQGACDYLKKPITAQQLHAAVVRAIEVRRLNTSLPPYDATRALMKSTNRQDLTISQFLKRKRAEEELRLMQFSVEHALDAVFWMDSEGRIVYANAAACRSLGRSRDELLTLSIPDINPHCRKSGWGKVWKEIKGHGSLIIETEHQTKQGHVFPVEISAKYLEFGGKEYSFTFARDITERKRGQSAFEASERRYRRFVERNSAGVVCNTMDGAILDCNEAAVRLLGYDSVADLKTCRMADLYCDPKDRDAMLALLKKERALNGYEFQFKRKDGIQVWFLANMTLAEDEGKEVIEATAVDITSRKASEENLRESEERFRVMADGCPALMWVTDAKGEIQFINRAYREFCDVTVGEVTGGKWQLLTHPDDMKEYAAAFHQAVREHTPFQAEVRLRRADGEWRWLGSHAEPRFSMDGEYLGHVGLSPDITERRKFEKELYRSRQVLQCVLDNIPQRVFWKDRNSVYIGCNRAFATDAGLSSPAEIAGKTDLDLLWAGTAEQYLADDRRVMEQGTAKLNRESSRSKPDGSLAWLLSNKMPTRDAAGNVTGVLGTYDDITDYKRAEEALRESEETLRVIVENSFDVIFTLDKDGAFVFASRAWERHFGYPVSEVIGKHFAPFVHPEDVTPCTEYLMRVLSTGKSETSPAFRVEHADGTWRWFIVNGTPYVNAKGEQQFIGVGRDVTESKQQEEALRESEAKLREALQAAQMGVWEWARATDTINWDENLYRLAGRDPNLPAPSFEKLQSLFAPESWQRMRAAVEKARATGIPYELDLEMVRPDGSKT